MYCKGVEVGEDGSSECDAEEALSRWDWCKILSAAGRPRTDDGDFAELPLGVAGSLKWRFEESDSFVSSSIPFGVQDLFLRRMVYLL